jgi:hypothetical protein
MKSEAERKGKRKEKQGRIRKDMTRRHVGREKERA